MKTTFILFHVKHKKHYKYWKHVFVGLVLEITPKESMQKDTKLLAFKL